MTFYFTLYANDDDQTGRAFYAHNYDDEAEAEGAAVRAWERRHGRRLEAHEGHLVQFNYAEDYDRDGIITDGTHRTRPPSASSPLARPGRRCASATRRWPTSP